MSAELSAPKMFVTVEEHILTQQHNHPTATGSFSWLLSGIALAARMISAKVRRAGILDVLGEDGDINVHGEQQQKLDILANKTIEQCLGYRGNVGIIASKSNPTDALTKRSSLGASSLRRS